MGSIPLGAGAGKNPISEVNHPEHGRGDVIDAAYRHREDRWIYMVRWRRSKTIDWVFRAQKGGD